MHKKSLEIAERLGLQDVLASEYGNLGVIYGMRGELDKAEEMFTKSLEIEKTLGRLQGIADDYSNLGLIYKERGDVKTALRHWEKAKDLYQRIGMPHMVKKVQGWIDEIKDKGESKK
jgi:tetratricopeptide (TPR) repeat protein